MAVPNVTARSGGQQTTDTTSHVITFPSFSVGQLLLVVIAIDGRVRFTIGSGSGWNQVGRNPNGITSLGVFWKIATGTGDNLTLTSDSAQQSVHNSWAISGGYYVEGNPGQRTDGQVFDHYPLDNLGDYLGIIGQAANGVVTIAAPSSGGWANSVLRTPSGAASATLFSCEAGFSNSYIIPAATMTGSGFPLTYNLPNFVLSVSESNPYTTGHARVFSREVTDLSAATQTSHSINMPPNIEVGDLLITFFSAYGNTSVSIDTTASGPYWRENNGDQNHVFVSSGVYFKTAEATNALTLTTGAATKSHAITACIKNWSRVVESSSQSGNYVKGSGTYDHPVINYASVRKKLMVIRAFAVANSYWYGAGQNYWTGFPFSAAGSGSSINYGEDAGALFKEYDYGSYGYPANENWITWYYAIEGKHMETVDFVGWRNLTFAGTSSGQSISLTTVNDFNSAAVSVRTGDLVIFGFSTASTVDRTTGASNLAITSSGWTLIDQKRYVNGSTYDTNMVMYYKVMGDTPDSTVAFTGSFSVQDAGSATVYVFRGCDPINPIDNVAWTSGTGTTLPAPLSIDYNYSGSYPMQYVAQAAANTGILVPANNWYYIFGNQTDTNSINTTMSYDLPRNIKRFVPSAFTGGSNATSAGNSWGAYTLAIRPRDNANTFTWTHEAGTRANISYFSTSQVSYVSQVGQKGSVSARIAPNNYQSLIYTDQISQQKFWVQARVNIIVTQNPTANSIISLFGLHNYIDSGNTWTNFVAQAEIKTNGQIFFSLFHGANNLTIPANTAFVSNTWNYIAMVADYSTQRENQMTFKVNNVNIGTANIFSALWRPHVLAGRTTEQSGSSNWNGFVYIDNMQFSTTDWPTYPTGRPKVYNGSTWVNKPLKRWNGSAWVEEPMYYYNGTNFEYIT